MTSLREVSPVSQISTQVTVENYMMSAWFSRAFLTIAIKAQNSFSKSQVTIWLKWPEEIVASFWALAMCSNIEEKSLDPVLLFNDVQWWSS